jgi:hypothetical protein
MCTVGDYFITPVAMTPQQSKKSIQPSPLSTATYMDLLGQLDLISGTMNPRDADYSCVVDIGEDHPHHGIAIIFSIMQFSDEVGSRFDNVRLSAVVSKCLDMDLPEARFLFALAGAPYTQTEQSPQAFNKVLHEVIYRYRLQNLFCAGASGEHHRGVTPTGYNEITGDTYADEMARWRADFRAMAPERQMMAATIIWLYQSGPDTTWLRRVPCTWRASEALNYLRDANCLSDWLRLLATYPGW